MQSAKEVSSCSLVIITPGTYESLVKHIKYSICHQGVTVWGGPSGEVPLHGQQLRQSLLGGQMDVQHDQAQGYSEISKAPIQDLEKALGEAIHRCQSEDRGPLFATDLHWVWTRGGARDLYASGQRKDYYGEHGVCHIFNAAEAHDDRIKNICYGFDGPTIQRTLDSFGHP